MLVNASPHRGTRKCEAQSINEACNYDNCIVIIFNSNNFHDHALQCALILQFQLRATRELPICALSRDALFVSDSTCHSLSLSSAKEGNFSSRSIDLVVCTRGQLNCFYFSLLNPYECVQNKRGSSKDWPRNALFRRMHKCVCTIPSPGQAFSVPTDRWRFADRTARPTEGLLACRAGWDVNVIAVVTGRHSLLLFAIFICSWIQIIL